MTQPSEASPDVPEDVRQRLLHAVPDDRARGLLESLLNHFGAALADSASPERALAGFERLLRNTPAPANLLETLAFAPQSISVLATLFAGSQFLTDILLRNPDYVVRITERTGIGQTKSPTQFDAEARAAVSYANVAPFTRAPLDALRRYQRAELLRIGAGDLCGVSALPAVTGQLSHLADSLIRACAHDVAVRLGAPLDGFAVIALGKLGGQELNYSSDVDLLFLTDRDAASFQRAGERLIAALTETTEEGFLYRVDMRLRPWGRVGPLIPTQAGFLGYLQRYARLWEKQALLKARPVAGDLKLGRRFLDEVQSLLYAGAPADVRRDVRAMKQLTEDTLRQQGRDWGEVKLGEGSIRDVEFVVQYLQLIHGASSPALLTGNTLDALVHLGEMGLLPPDEHRVLTDGYTFLRTLEHYLQILDYRQTHTLPRTETGLRYLARRLGFAGPEAAARLVTQYQQHAAAVRAIYHHYLMADPADDSPTPNGGHAMAHPSQDAGLIQRHVARLAPTYSASFSAAEIARHAEMAVRLDPEHPVEVAPDAPARRPVMGNHHRGLRLFGCTVLDLRIALCARFQHPRWPGFHL